ncbi:MAG: DUF2066 domain-containing protein [Rhodospirillales bacterium]
MILALLLLPVARPALADLFTVPGVIVSVAANSSAEAKAQGTATAQTQAFRRLAERLVVPADLAALPQVNAARVEPTVSSVTVLDEVVTDTTFDGRFTVRFDPAETRRLLDELGLRYTEVQSRPFVVVPVFASGDQAFLWRDPNPWRTAWAGYPGVGDSLVPILVPLGDIKDVVAVDAERALSGDRRGLGDLASNYDAAGSLVTRAQVTGNPWDGGAGLAISLQTYGEDLGQIAPVSLTQAPDEAAEAFYQRGVIATMQAVETAWKSANAVQFGASNDIRVRALASALQDWLLIQRSLEAEPLVSNVAVLSLRRGEVVVDLTHRGTPEQLQRALAQRGLTLLQASGGWDLQLGGLTGVEARPLPLGTPPVGEESNE